MLNVAFECEYQIVAYQLWLVLAVDWRCQLNEYTYRVALAQLNVICLEPLCSTKILSVNIHSVSGLVALLQSHVPASYSSPRPIVDPEGLGGCGHGRKGCVELHCIGGEGEQIGCGGGKRLVVLASREHSHSHCYA